MGKPLYDRTTAKSRPLEMPKPLKRRRIGAANRRPLGIAVAGGAALLVTGVVALAIRPQDGAGSVSALNTISRNPDSARKLQVAKAAAEAPRTAEQIAPGTPPTGEQTLAPAPPNAETLRPDRVAAMPASDAPISSASIGPTVEGSGAPEPSAPSEPPRNLVATSAAAPLDCVGAELRTVLADVAARFGPVNVVSTNRLNADNHTPGTARHNLHTACKAVDFKTGGNLREVLAYLRSRPEVSGINSYRGGLIHIDLNQRSRAADLRPRVQPVANE